MTTSYKYHEIQILRNEYKQNEVTSFNFNFKISGKLIKRYEHKERFDSFSKALESAKNTIDEKYDELEYDNDFKREQTLKHFEFFKEHLKEYSLDEKELNQFALDLTIAHIKKEAIEKLDLNIEVDTSDIKSGLDEIAANFRTFWTDKSIASVFEEYFKNKLEKEE